MVTEVCAKSDYYRLPIDKALRNWKSDNNKKQQKEKTTFVAPGDPFRVQEIDTFKIDWQAFLNKQPVSQRCLPQIQHLGPLAYRWTAN